MLRYILGRVLGMIPTLFVVSVFIFVIIQLPPGDFLTTLEAQLASQGDGADLTFLENLRSRYALDQPLVVQYLNWIWGIVSAGDFGQSFEWNKPVADLIAPRLGLTLGLSMLAVVLTALISVPLGVISAVKQYSIVDYTASFLGFLGLAIPNVLLALLLMYFSLQVLGVEMGGLYSAAYVDAPWSIGKAWDLALHLWIPVVVLVTAGTAEFVRIMRATTLDELSRPYVETARAKGVPEGRAILKYPVRVALNPFVSKLGWMLPVVISSEAVVSIVVGIPTTGPLLLRSLQAQDMYLAGGIILMLSVLTIVGTLVSDILLAVIDPRIRYA